MPRPRSVETSLPAGIERRHVRGCPGAPCKCDSYRAIVWDRRTKTRVKKTFSGPGALGAAKSWRIDALSQLQRGTNIAPSSVTLQEVAEQWLAGATAQPPTTLNRSGEPFKPSALRGYEGDLRTYVLPYLGSSKLTDIRRADLQMLVDKLLGAGYAGSTVRNIVTVVKTVYRYALDRELTQVNPTSNLRLPNGVKHRDRAASREELAELLAPLPAHILPVYATAAYAGLRRGELRGLRWEDVDFEGRRINVRRSYDDVAGVIAPKSKSSVRSAPLPRELARILAAWKLQSTHAGDGDYVFASPSGGAFTSNNVRQRAAVAWKSNPELKPIGLHECRHSFVSLAFAADVRRETVQDWIGHSSGSVTDVYRHTRPEVFDAEVAKLDAYLSTGKALTVAV